MTAARAKEYRRLPGTGRRPLGYTRLYLGSDHLLHVDSSGYAEDYRRFYFKDVQAVVVRRTGRYEIVSIVLGALFLIPLLSGLAVEDEVLRGLLWVSLAAPLLLGLVIHLLYGPTCVTQIQTAAQILELRSLGRVRRARRVIRRLQPLIESAQGRLTSDELVARAREAASV